MYTFLISLIGFVGYNLNYFITVLLSLFFDIYIFNSKNDSNYSQKLLDYIIKENDYKESFMIQSSKEKPNGLCLSREKFASYIIYETSMTNHQIKTDFIIYFIGDLPFEVKEIKQEIEIDIKTNEKKA